MGPSVHDDFMMTFLATHSLGAPVLAAPVAASDSSWGQPFMYRHSSSVTSEGRVFLQDNVALTALDEVLMPFPLEHYY